MLSYPSDRYISIPLGSILHTFTVLLVRVVLTICFPVAAQGTIYALPTLTLELGVRAHWAVLLVTVVFTLSEAIATPGHRDAVNFTCETGELLRGACWWFFENQANKQELKIQVNKQQIGQVRTRAQLLSYIKAADE